LGGKFIFVTISLRSGSFAEKHRVKGPLATFVQSSYFDFSRTSETQNVTNKYVQGPSAGNATCTISQLPITQAAAQQLPSAFLRDSGQYSGEAHLPGYPGAVDLFTAFFGPVVVDFYFTKEGNWVRFDQRSPDKKTTVVTQIFNFAESAEFQDSVFADYKRC